MVLSKPDDHIVAPRLFKWMFFFTLCAGSAVCAQAQDARANNADESWTATTQTSIDNTNPAADDGEPHQVRQSEC